jgi:hypothetical protein
MWPLDGGNSNETIFTRGSACRFGSAGSCGSVSADDTDGSHAFSTTSAGAWNNYSELNTVGGDNWWDLWLALNPDGTSPVNGPSDAQAGISIPLQLGKRYKYYFFASGPCCTSSQSFNALNLFFNGNSSTPCISAFGALNNPNFSPDSNTTITLEAAPVAGSGTASTTPAVSSWCWESTLLMNLRPRPET